MAVYVLRSELALYCVVKELRRDLWYWMPLYGFSGDKRGAKDGRNVAISVYCEALCEALQLSAF